jgi:ubiquinone/menaquinone biosynthesis C-methylase UbiE
METAAGHTTLSEEERLEKLTEWYDAYECVSELILDSNLKGSIREGAEWNQNFRTQLVLNLAGDVSGKTLIDIGCQYGVFSFKMREAGAQVVGLEISERWVDRCRREAAEKPEYNDVSFVKGDAQVLPFEDESFDVALCLEVIEHTVSPGRALKEINRVLKPDGILVLGTPNASSYYVRLYYALKSLLPMRSIRWVLRRIAKSTEKDIVERIKNQLPEDRRADFEKGVDNLERIKRELGSDNPEEEFSEHIREFSNKEIEKLLDFSGFQVQERTGFPFFPTYFFLGLRMLLRKHLKVKKDSPWRYRSSPQVYLRAVKNCKGIF